MVHAGDLKMGCVCPECKERCTDCLGTNSVMSREEIINMGKIPGMLEKIFFSDEDEEDM